MLEPSKPVTLNARYTPYPAVELESDEGKALHPGSVVLRHRHLKQQFTIVSSKSRRKPQHAYHFVAPTVAVPAAVGPQPVHLTITQAIGVAPRAASVVAQAVAGSAGSSVIPVPPSADSSTIAHSAAAPHHAFIPSTAEALAGGVLGVAAPSSFVGPVLAAGVTSSVVHGVKADVASPVHPPPVQAARRNTSRSHELVETSNNSLVVRRGQHAIRDKKGQTIWFYSDGQTYLLEPPLIQGATLSDLYVHTAANRDKQIWIFNRKSQWEKIQLLHPHPILSGYVLHLVSDGDPRWIHKTTVTTYRGREKRHQLMYSRGEAEAAPTSSGQAPRLAGTP